MATQQTAYEDVIQLFGKSQRTLTPTISGGGARELFEKDPSLKTDPRFTLYPQWMQRRVAQNNYSFAVDPRGGSGKMVLDVMKAGGLIVAGTDTPNAINLHGEIKAYTMAGMSSFDALKTATVNPAKALGLNAGTIEPGKLADLIAIDGDPIADIANTVKVKKVIANGRVYDVAELVKRGQ
jgi:imidazolonepropionase-like amidohydrolase